jgi:ribA/ribD-fused uncharacterized protein
MELPSDNRILFFGRDRAAFGFLSNFHPSPVTLDGYTWPTVEHFYQAQKSFDPEYRELILASRSPGRVKRLAAPPWPDAPAPKPSYFRKHPEAIRPDWHTAKLAIMERAVLAKFEQNDDLAQLLLATGTAELVEDSAAEPFWGIGPDGSGQNCLGKILMNVRQTLRKNRTPTFS